jgi:hypothetical protein
MKRIHFAFLFVALIGFLAGRFFWADDPGFYDGSDLARNESAPISTKQKPASLGVEGDTQSIHRQMLEVFY